MGGIFISYRRDDTAPYARLLSEALASRFGADRVFRDIDTLTPGTDFPRAIADAVESCDVLLALIGPGWLTAERDGRRRLDDPGDFVRLEIAAALERGTLVVPVLMERTPMPAGHELPAPIAALADRNALRLTDESWGDGVRRLLEALERLVPPSEAAAPASPPGAAPGGDHITAHIAGSVPGQVAVGTGIVQTQSPPAPRPPPPLAGDDAARALAALRERVRAELPEPTASRALERVGELEDAVSRGEVDDVVGEYVRSWFAEEAPALAAAAAATLGSLGAAGRGR